MSYFKHMSLWATPDAALEHWSSRDARLGVRVLSCVLFFLLHAYITHMRTEAAAPLTWHTATRCTLALAMDDRRLSTMTGALSCMIALIHMCLWYCMHGQERTGARADSVIVLAAWFSRPHTAACPLPTLEYTSQPNNESRCVAMWRSACHTDSKLLPRRFPCTSLGCVLNKFHPPPLPSPVLEWLPVLAESPVCLRS